MVDDPAQYWTKTAVQNLVRHRSGRYYARIYIGGKETWRALRTDKLEVAKAKLAKLSTETQRVAKARRAANVGKMTVGDCSTIFLERVTAGYGMRGKADRTRRIRPSSVLYRQQTVEALWRSWPELKGMDVRKVTTLEAESWATRFAMDYSPTRFNNTLDTFRALMGIAVDAGACSENPAQRLGKVETKPKALNLPSRAEFRALVDAIRANGHKDGKDCGNLVEFLAYTGARKTEAANVVWGDLDLTTNRLHLRITKGGRARYVPMIEPAKELILRMMAAQPNASPSARIFKVREARGTMDTACEATGCPRVTHHDLRHMFATACIEAGVDIPTISRWLGHRDGGALAMRTYGHLRDDHSQAQAKKVSFA